MSRTALRLAVASFATSAIVGIAAGPALASPCASGEKITGKTPAGWICTNLETGVDRIVPFG